MRKACGGKNRAGGTCAQPAGFGTNHPGYGNCKWHGGASPNGQKHAAKERAEQEVVTYGLPREIDPHDALLEELYRTAGHVAWLGTVVADLPEGHVVHLIEGTEREDDRLQVIDAKPSVWVELYQRERKHLAAIAKTCVDVGIEERRVKVAEQQGELLADVIRGVLTDLGVADHPEAPTIVRRHLTLMAGGQAA